MKLAPELPALVMYLDPVNMIIQLPTIPDGAQLLAKFCRELSREAAKLADMLDPPGDADAASPGSTNDYDGDEADAGPPGVQPD